MNRTSPRESRAPIDAVFALHAWCVLLERLRRAAIHLLALAGVFAWCAAEWPSLIAGSPRFAVLGLWAAVFVVAVAAVIAERCVNVRFRRKVEACKERFPEHSAGSIASPPPLSSDRRP